MRSSTNDARSKEEQGRILRSFYIQDAAGGCGRAVGAEFDDSSKIPRMRTPSLTRREFLQSTAVAGWGGDCSCCSKPRRHWSSPEMWVTCAYGPYNFEFMTAVHKEIMSRYHADGIFLNRRDGFSFLNEFPTMGSFARMLV
jgi:hypothetical protein